MTRSRTLGGSSEQPATHMSSADGSSRRDSRSSASRPSVAGNVADGRVTLDAYGRAKYEDFAEDDDWDFPSDEEETENRRASLQSDLKTSIDALRRSEIHFQHVTAEETIPHAEQKIADTPVHPMKSGRTCVERPSAHLVSLQSKIRHPLCLARRVPARVCVRACVRAYVRGGGGA